MRFEINNLQELNKVAIYLKDKLTKNVCILLIGQMGAGKTTFTKELLKEFGVKEIVTSPTFTIMNQYGFENFKINHIDAYRLTLQEDPQMYLEEMIDSINIVEWSQNLDINYESYFKVIKVTIDVIDETKRVFEVEEIN
ncbi:tRNA (adenosine(37)-N6)-threonylcarbamoyltransferase complex ATPase subunit type 1 TsaE [Spiroplasma sp. BIUS-1]|uniref:tRNA (adenosine(37)-N6)-threonylcarbamoyltransferase complex ATPase subunit type 1 TsaE n=1 Tax=Spiroplasma sp. BIUS-1 TaxID=216964 RepID=UPI001397DA2C|nr:tRNA (adenosine(37)-N6)-threonylcarbamoyltransferase complex ATPase subunit type 1 TsaE [Spiroplasma sp. BIUS-1]QHX36407.1 tRNA threonylcarbamoyladenosine biosynthesis protein TsaE [Spiroplasma sp. BIUS-1]